MTNRGVTVRGAIEEAAQTLPNEATHPPPHIMAAVSRRRKKATSTRVSNANPASVRIGSSAMKSRYFISCYFHDSHLCETIADAPVNAWRRWIDDPAIV